MTPHRPIVLIGTVHLDPDGAEALDRLLRKLQPAVVTVDVSPFAIEFRRARGKKLLEVLAPRRGPDGRLPPALEAVAAQLAVPFEARVAGEFAAAAGIEARFLGDSEESRFRLHLLETELFAPENLDRLAVAPQPSLAEQVRAERARARSRLSAGNGIPGPASLQAADSRMATLLENIPGEDLLVHITGWEHLPGLESRLARHHPRALLLAPEAVISG